VKNTQYSTAVTESPLIWAQKIKITHGVVKLAWIYISTQCNFHLVTDGDCCLTEHAGQNHSPWGTSNSAGRRQYRWNAWLQSSHSSRESSSPFLRQILHFYNNTSQHVSHTVGKQPTYFMDLILVRCSKTWFPPPDLLQLDT